MRGHGRIGDFYSPPLLCLGSGMPSLPASQPAEDGEADGATVPPTVDLSSEEPPVTHGGARKSVGPPHPGVQPNDILYI